MSGPAPASATRRAAADAHPSAAAPRSSARAASASIRGRRAGRQATALEERPDGSA